MPFPVTNETDFLTCMDRSKSAGVKFLTPDDLKYLKALAKTHKALLKTCQVPDNLIFSNALVNTSALQNLIANVPYIRVYIGLSFETGTADYTFIMTQCDENGVDMIDNVGGVNPVYHEFCCKCPPDSNCPGAKLLEP